MPYCSALGGKAVEVMLVRLVRADHLDAERLGEFRSAACVVDVAVGDEDLFDGHARLALIAALDPRRHRRPDRRRRRTSSLSSNSSVQFC